jgi:hypothetical protein
MKQLMQNKFCNVKQSDKPEPPKAAVFTSRESGQMQRHLLKVCAPSMLGVVKVSAKRVRAG